MKEGAKYMLTGLLAGVANGLFGAGGGLVLVPLLTRWLGLERRQALATSVAAVLCLSGAALVSYARQGGVDVAMALPYLAGGLVGGAVSGKVLGRVPVVWLRRSFGALMVYAGVRGVALL